MNNVEALKIFEACVNEMYKCSSPPSTWTLIKKRYGGTGKTFTDKHRLSGEQYDRIKGKYSKRLDAYYRRKLDWFLLDYAPTILKTGKVTGE